ncbi:AAA family ATPase, partial [Vibrio cholerae]
MKIAISGTYSTGKTTLTEALSIATQVPRTQARTMREILPDAVPGKTL